MREVTVENDNPKMNYFLPHHGVYRPEKSTTKLNGGVIQDDLYAQMIRFRTFRYALTADIKKMHRMILIDSEQHCLQRILWKDNKHDRVKTYELQTVTIAKIQDLFPWQWRQVPSNQNPADLISRGVDPDKLLNHELWWNGPEFLSGSNYPNKTVKISENNDAYNSELKNSVREKLGKEVPVLNICVNDFVNNLCNISNNYLTPFCVS
ncbi:uncharacterized protein TNCV_1361851 [Trichonephila clavipes]|nr:uncharacterized protein TNCV_1361851 [Trichonephila clavipes]